MKVTLTNLHNIIVPNSAESRAPIDLVSAVCMQSINFLMHATPLFENRHFSVLLIGGVTGVILDLASIYLFSQAISKRLKSPVSTAGSIAIFSCITAVISTRMLNIIFKGLSNAFMINPRNRNSAKYFQTLSDSLSTVLLITAVAAIGCITIALLRKGTEKTHRLPV